MSATSRSATSAAEVTPVAPLGLTGVALGVWAGLIGSSWLWGTLLRDGGARLHLHAPPLVGTWDLRLGLGVLAPIAVAGLVIWVAPAVVRRASWPVLLVSVAIGALAFSLALALIDGGSEITAPLLRDTQYLHAVDAVRTPGDFLSGFVDRIDSYPTHVRAHPPLMMLVLWGLAQIGLGGAGPAAALVIGAGVSAGPAALISLRRIAGEAAARRAAPFFVLTAAALTIVTNADALFMAVGAWGITALTLAILDRRDGLALVGGLLLGLAVFCSYGLVLLAAVPLAVAIASRRVRELAVALLGAVAVAAAFAAAGFWWFDGLAATRREYAESAALTRPYGFFLVSNLAAFAVILGPAVAVALGRLRDRRIWILVGGGLAAVVLADLSGLSKAEVERIWLPFWPWIVLACAALEPSRLALAAQAAVAITVGVTVTMPW